MGARAKKESVTVASAVPVGPEACGAFAAELRAALESGAERIVVDLSEADAIDGACLALLISATGRLADDRTLGVIVSPQIERALTDWRFDTLLTLTGETASKTASQ